MMRRFLLVSISSVGIVHAEDSNVQDVQQGGISQVQGIVQDPGGSASRQNPVYHVEKSVGYTQRRSGIKKEFGRSTAGNAVSTAAENTVMPTTEKRAKLLKSQGDLAKALRGNSNDDVGMEMEVVDHMTEGSVNHESNSEMEMVDHMTEGPVNHESVVNHARECNSMAKHVVGTEGNHLFGNDVGGEEGGSAKSTDDESTGVSKGTTDKTRNVDEQLLGSDVSDPTTPNPSTDDGENAASARKGECEGPICGKTNDEFGDGDDKPVGQSGDQSGEQNDKPVGQSDAQEDDYKSGEKEDHEKFDTKEPVWDKSEEEVHDVNSNPSNNLIAHSTGGSLFRRTASDSIAPPGYTRDDLDRLGETAKVAAEQQRRIEELIDGDPVGCNCCLACDQKPKNLPVVTRENAHKTFYITIPDDSPCSWYHCHCAQYVLTNRLQPFYCRGLKFQILLYLSFINFFIGLILFLVIAYGLYYNHCGGYEKAKAKAKAEADEQMAKKENEAEKVNNVLMAFKTVGGDNENGSANNKAIDPKAMDQKYGMWEEHGGIPGGASYGSFKGMEGHAAPVGSRAVPPGGTFAETQGGATSAPQSAGNILSGGRKSRHKLGATTEEPCPAGSSQHEYDTSLPMSIPAADPRSIYGAAGKSDYTMAPLPGGGVMQNRPTVEQLQADLGGWRSPMKNRQEKYGVAAGTFDAARGGSPGGESNIYSVVSNLRAGGGIFSGISGSSGMGPESGMEGPASGMGSPASGPAPASAMGDISVPTPGMGAISAPASAMGDNTGNMTYSTIQNGNVYPTAIDRGSNSH